MKLSFREIDEIEVFKVDAKKKDKEEGKEKKHLWSKEEDKMLIKLCNSKIQKKWKKIAEIIGTKSATQCAYHYSKLKKKKVIKKRKQKEDVLFTDEKVGQFFRKYELQGLNLKKDSKGSQNNIELTEAKTANTSQRNINSQNSFPSLEQTKQISSQSSLEEKLSGKIFRLKKPTFRKDDTLDFPEFYQNGGRFERGDTFYVLNSENYGKQL